MVYVCGGLFIWVAFPMSDKECPGNDGFACIQGWLYSCMGMMIFPTNKKCPVCKKADD